MIVTAIVVVAWFHGATVGARSAAGRTGLVQLRSHERAGAGRGVAVMSALLVIAFGAGTIATSGDPARADAYVTAMTAMLWVFGPAVALAMVAILAARVAAWPVAAFLDAVVMGGLEFVRPVIMVTGVAVAIHLTRDVTIAAILVAAAAGALSLKTALNRWEASRSGAQG